MTVIMAQIYIDSSIKKVVVESVFLPREFEVKHSLHSHVGKMFTIIYINRIGSFKPTALPSSLTYRVAYAFAWQCVHLFFISSVSFFA